MGKIKTRKYKGGYFPPIGNLIRVENPNKVVYKQPTKEYYSQLENAWINEGRPFTPSHINCEKRLDLFQWDTKEGQIYPDENYCIHDGKCRMENGKCKRHPPIMCRHRYGTSWDKNNNECTIDNICGRCGPTKDFCCEKDNGWHEKTINNIIRCGKSGLGTGVGTKCMENNRLLISFPINIGLFNNKDLKKIAEKVKIQMIRRFKISHKDIINIDVYSGSTIVRVEFSPNIEKYSLKFIKKKVQDKPIKILAKNFIISSNCVSLVSSGEKVSCIKSLVLVVPGDYDNLTDDNKQVIKDLIIKLIEDVISLRKKDIPKILIKKHNEQQTGGGKKFIKIILKFNPDTDGVRNQEVFNFLKSDDFYNKMSRMLAGHLMNIDSIISGDPNLHHSGFMVYTNTDILEDEKQGELKGSDCEQLKQIAQKKDLINNNNNRKQKRQKSIQAVCDYEKLSPEEKKKKQKEKEEEKKKTKEEQEKKELKKKTKKGKKKKKKK